MRLGWSRFLVMYLLTVMFALILPSTTYALNTLSPQEEESRVNEIYDNVEDRMESIYDKAMNRAKQMNTSSVSGEDNIKSMVRVIYRIYKALESVAIYIAGLSILFGLGLAYIVRYNRSLFRRYILLYVFAVPILLGVVFLGIGILIG